MIVKTCMPHAMQIYTQVLCVLTAEVTPPNKPLWLNKQLPQLPWASKTQIRASILNGQEITVA